MAQLDAKNGGLYLVQSGVAPDYLVLVADARAMIAEGTHGFRERRVVGRDRAALAIRPEILREVEAETGQVTHRASSLLADAGAVRLAGVLDDGDAAGAQSPGSPAYPRGDHR